MLNTSNKDERLLLHMTGMQLRFKIKTEKLFAIFLYMFLSKCISSLNKVEEWYLPKEANLNRPNKNIIQIEL